MDPGSAVTWQKVAAVPEARTGEGDPGPRAPAPPARALWSCLSSLLSLWQPDPCRDAGASLSGEASPCNPERCQARRSPCPGRMQVESRRGCS